MIAWHRKYKDQGLVVVGVHTPELEQERWLPNVKKAVAEMGIEYPVAIDNDYAAWNRYHNEAWPAFYLVDAEGRIVYSVYGEHNYSATEQKIRELLEAEPQRH